MKPNSILSTLFAILIFSASPLAGKSMKNLSEINIRDPYILTDRKSGNYYMYKSASVNTSGKRVGGVAVYKSKNLKEWKGPLQVFTVPQENWITGAVWAPEVHAYNGKYYLFATLNSDIEWKKELKGWPKYTFRGTQIFVSDNPEGPFLPFGNKPHTPIERMALDGTLWVEIADRSMVLVELAADLSVPVGESRS